MQIFKKAAIVGGFALLALVITAPDSFAQISNQATEMTFNQPVRIPGQVLPAGTYWFTVLDNINGSKNVVQIRNADNTKLFATLLTRTTDLTGGWGQEATINGVRWPTGKLVLTFAEGQNQQPPALLDWYYPGRTDGHQFIYSDQRQKQFDEENHQTVPISVANEVTIGSSPAGF